SPFPVVVSFINYFLSKAGTEEFSKGSESICLPAFMRSLDISSDALRHDFLQVFHVFRAGLVNDFGAFARDVSRKEGLALEYAVKNFFHPEGETVRLGEARDFWFAIARPQNRGELAETIKSLVIHLDRDDALELVEDFFEPVRQRMQMAKMQ